RGPALVVLDDLHAADRATLVALHFVARALRALPLVIVGTHRDADARLEGETRALLERIGREGTALPLGRLDRAAVAARGGELEPVPPGVADQVYEASGGNPLFVSELLRHVRSGAPARQVPESARALVSERLAGLTGEERALLETAAVLGRE